MIQEQHRLHTETLTLRPVNIEDLASVHEILSDPESTKFWSQETSASISQSEQQLDIYLPKHEVLSSYAWAITVTDTAEFIGWIGFYDFRKSICSINYALKKTYWGQGIMSQVLGLAIEDGIKRFSLHRIEAKIHPDNHASRILLLKNRFVVEGYFRQDFYRAGTYEDTIYLAHISQNTGQTNK
ncbi:MAG: GNAT family N-acetyltransferase [Pseudobacteriovorax sp.]|nr:GNAT family N-acetyltransferase [Pseudobacteriovorax sp.]